MVTARKDRGMNARVQRLHASAEHLGYACELLDPLDVEADLGLEEIGGPAARDELEAELVETARELLQPCLVVDGDQRAHSSRTTSGRSRCSTA